MGTEAGLALGKELMEYKEQKVPYNTAYNSRLPAQQWWGQIRTGVTEPAYLLAVIILDMVPHAAGPERIFSYMGWFKSKLRNGLKPETVAGMVQIKQYCSQHEEK